MVRLSLLSLLLGFICSFACASDAKNDIISEKRADDEKTSKLITSADIYYAYKKKIAPVKLNDIEENISINRGRARSVFTSGDLGDKNLNISVKQLEDADPQELIIKGYNASLAGHVEAALTFYKMAAHADGKNENVLFALASLYHKLSQRKEAKIYYKKLLMLNGEYIKALNNYIVLMSEESPGQALMELKEMEKVNPDFSPVQAQIAMIYARISNYEQAEEYMKRAIKLEPQEVSYRYNLAVIYDSAAKYREAIVMYKQLVDNAITKGELPQGLHTIKNRLTYLQEKITLQRKN